MQQPLLLGLAFLGLSLGGRGLRAQNIEPNQQTAVENTNAQTLQDQKIQQLQDKLEEIQKELMELKRANSTRPETHPITTAQPSASPSSVSASTPPSSVSPSAPPPAVSEVETAITDPSNPHSEPFAFADFTWLNGNPRTKDTPYATKYFTPEIRSDVSYTYDFRHPKDDTIVGSSEIFRANEVTLTDLGIGGDFHVNNVRARFLSQIGLYSTAIPANDASSARGQFNLANAYRYVSEANAGYHFNVQHGLNVDAGVFLSYVGLFSFYQFDNWAYQPSYVSSNTPWFFTGVRLQWYPTAKLKIEPWFVNGWQSYGKFNNRPGIGGQILWRPNGKLQ
ncbi:MAG TPA: outer membrane beta-barrel protein, partial [Acidobacteriaceae bacterium]|nr:outer membrane beta-barrel protein [Acidobacteriaceae bacterium]